MIRFALTRYGGQVAATVDNLRLHPRTKVGGPDRRQLESAPPPMVAAARGISPGWRIHQIVRTEYSLMGSSFVTKSSPSATAWAIRIRSNGSLCSIGRAASAVT